jgi:hypothetical protein
MTLGAKYMGIHFSCHLCNHSLHVKDFQAGKRGKCPNCNGSFRIPAKDSDFSLALEESLSGGASTLVAEPKSMLASKSKAQGRSSSNVPVMDPISDSRSDHYTTETTSKFRQETKSDAAKTSPPAPVSDIPPSLMPALEARWFVRPPSGGQYGPAPTRLLVEWIAERRVTADSLLWSEGMSQWQSAIQALPELFSNSPADLSLPSVSATPLAPSIPTCPSPPVGSMESLASELIEEASSASVAASKGHNAIKKRRLQRQKWLVLCGLLIVSAGLLVALVAVLWNQANR